VHLKKKKKKKLKQAPVAQTCNPSYSGSKDQEDYSSKQVQTVLENLSQNPIIHQKKKGLVEWLKV
jgi:hypothetical protein